MTLLWVGVVAIVLGGGLLLLRRPLTAWNARGPQAMKSAHIRQVSEADDGTPRYILGVGTLILVVGAVLVIIGAGHV